MFEEPGFDVNGVVICTLLYVISALIWYLLGEAREILAARRRGALKDSG